MGGNNETKVEGMRMHISNNEAHIHDDANGLKFSMDRNNFREEANKALKTLKKSEGIMEIPGDGKESLCIMRSGQIYTAFVKGNTSIKQKLQAFIKDC